MRWLLLLALCGSASAAETEVSIDRILHGQLDEVVLLGFSPDGAHWAYVDAHAKGTSFASAEGALLETATGKQVAHFSAAHDHDFDAHDLERIRARYDQFIGKVRAAGVSRENTQAWTPNNGRFARPDGAATLELVAWSGRELDDKGTGAFALRYTDTHNPEDFVDVVDYYGTPRIVEVLALQNGAAFIVRPQRDAAQCWHKRDCTVYAATLANMSAGRAARDLERVAITQYREGDLRAAQVSLRDALDRDPSLQRARYDLAAIDALLRGDHEAERMLQRLSDADAPLLRHLVDTDPAFIEARQRPLYHRFTGAPKEPVFSSPNRRGLETRLEILGTTSVSSTVQLALIVRNTTDKTQHFTRYATPFSKARAHYIEIIDDQGHIAPYSDELEMRNSAEEELVEPGIDARATFDLLRAYAIRPGRYNVRFLGGNASQLPNSPAISITITR